VSWVVSILIGVLMAAFGAVVGGLVADQAVRWLRVSTFEGAAGYAVVLWALLALIAGLVIGIGVSRWFGVADFAGAAKALGCSVLILGGGIGLAGGLSWLFAEHEPTLAGRPLTLAIELRLPSGAAKPGPQESYFPLILHSARRSTSGELFVNDVEQIGGEWIIPGEVELTTSRFDRVLGVTLDGSPAQYFDLPLPAKPGPEHRQWSAWATAPFLANREPPPQGTGYAVRYRVQPRRPPPHVAPVGPPPPTPEELKAQAFQALAPDAPTDSWLAFTALDMPPELRARAIAAVKQRADFAAGLQARIESDDPIVARDAMYLVGELEPPPAEVADAVRRWARFVIDTALAIDPNAENSRELLYDRAHVPATGVHAAAFGLRRAGVDIRPELRAMAEAAREREKASPRDIAEGSERIIAYFDKLDRDAAGK
jgi:hypothetical protein